MNAALRTSRNIEKTFQSAKRETGNRVCEDIDNYVNDGTDSTSYGPFVFADLWLIDHLSCRAKKMAPNCMK